MGYIFSAEALAVLRQYAGPDVICAFDFDGTLAPIVDDPETADMRETTAQLLARLAQARTCVAISGRSRDDLTRKLAGTGIAHFIGNHGAERWPGDGGALAERVRSWEETLHLALASIPGLWIENKLLSLTVHYRQCKRKLAARAVTMRAVSALSEARAVAGKDAISVVSPGAPHKGVAFAELLVRLGCDRAIYVGDDVTDEDVFALDDARLSLLTIRVGQAIDSRATYYLRDQLEMDRLLRHLVEWATS
jgi:trehalose 6-phosphate phosphatase